MCNFRKWSSRTHTLGTCAADSVIYPVFEGHILRQQQFRVQGRTVGLQLVSTMYSIQA